MSKENSISTSMIFKTLERYSVMLFQMVVQVVIARILSPSDYGVVAMMGVFINIATVITQNGFNRAVVQKKEADEKDFGTALTINTLISVFLYFTIFITAPWIAGYYNNPDIKLLIRVLALTLPISSINSIQIAVANRQMVFGSLFKCSLVASIVSGLIGVFCALLGFGVWALIIQQLTVHLITTIMMVFSLNWKPRFHYKVKSAKEMFSFGWKMMVAAMINTIYNELASLIIGRKYTSSDLAFYSKGKYFPNLITMGMDASMESVMLSAFSKKQDNEKDLHTLMKKSQSFNCYLLFPLLGIFAMVAKPTVHLLLTDKWLPCLPFLYLACFTCAFHPIASSQMQSIAAMGRSDVRLKLELLKKGIGIGLLIPAIKYGPLAIAINAAITGVIGVIINTVACRMVVKYPIRATIKDVLPIALATLFSIAPLYFLNDLQIGAIPEIIIKGIIGVGLYIAITAVFKFDAFVYFKVFVSNKIKVILKKKDKNDQNNNQC